MFPFKVVQLLAEMSEQVGPSCFKNTSHILQFAQVKFHFIHVNCLALSEVSLCSFKVKKVNFQ